MSQAPWEPLPGGDQGPLLEQPRRQDSRTRASGKVDGRLSRDSNRGSEALLLTPLSTTLEALPRRHKGILL